MVQLFGADFLGRVVNKHVSLYSLFMSYSVFFISYSLLIQFHSFLLISYSRLMNVLFTSYSIPILLISIYFLFIAYSFPMTQEIYENSKK